ncbi:hemerythrin superfamily protein [Novosphingobium chloroacetimidivorans]|uniref:Hemerythrin superfamily protein n=1 Tax=Novosphingobium chloroacetimidivorans TaxID=1428314 RepID=A0A7W7K959_9SPHN|nr:hemerythrin domain-containing protein [Novosphingobium chloroacetimidivorans]MBB4858226.1 hemerythrin superfamily protein [Novosphingobium chloroacetimidivorans]
MSLLDKIAAAVTPMASQEERAEARRKAEQLSQGDDWLGQILDHHRQIESAFDRALNAAGAGERRTAAGELAGILMAHANAEEAVIYPALVEGSSKAHATMAYEEQAAAKINMAILENLDPMSQEWRDKLEHIQGAVAQHVYQEESSWFPDVIQNVPLEKQQALSKRYAEEFGRYNRGSGSGSGGNQPAHLSQIA